jgi:hypothetical protein
MAPGPLGLRVFDALGTKVPTPQEERHPGCLPLRVGDQGHGRMNVRLLTTPGLAAPRQSLTRGVRVLDRA